MDCPCNRDIRVSQSHYENCFIYSRIWTLRALELNMEVDELIAEINRKDINSTSLEDIL